MMMLGFFYVKFGFSGLCVLNCLLCGCLGGVLLPSGVFGPHSGGGDAHTAGPGKSRAGEVPAVQRHLQRSKERKGRNRARLT